MSPPARIRSMTEPTPTPRADGKLTRARPTILATFGTIALFAVGFWLELTPTGQVVLDWLRN